MTDEIERRLIRINGVVQGVGYRPFVYQLAVGLGLTGWVLNDTLGVQTEVYGPATVLDAFFTALSEKAPPLAQVNEVWIERREPAGPVPDCFEIRQSERAGRADTVVAPDSHICEDCLREMFDPANRRYRYPFTNCTHCGPRYSLIRGVPYDRERTTMASFVMCADCAREYGDPNDRRYHAQPNACPRCGPKVTLSGPDAPVAESDQAVRLAVDALAAGRIVAVKSVGGFHLAVNARDADAVARLRRRKKRDSKPLALLVADLRTVFSFAECRAAEAQLLVSPARPIVLLRKHPGALPEEIAPRNPNFGVMLPCAPLHHLLLDRPGLDVLVMTSGNVSGQPIVYRNEDALDSLFEVADFVLHHDREIEVRVDDSVVRCSSHPELARPLINFIRRSRGYAPYPVRVAEKQEPVIAFGAELKTTVAMADGQFVFVSQHIGDLKNEETFVSHQRAAEHLSKLYELSPRYLACDLHPQFRATQFVTAASAEGAFAVQHHHAHMASCMAEHHLSGPTLGVIFDGAGYGADGTIWGGEFLLGEFERVERVSWLRRLPMLGGDEAVRQPIRTGFALALDALEDADAAAVAFPPLGELSEQQRRVYMTMFRRRLNAPLASSMGRLFDGVAALLGVCSHAEYEAQGPIELEGLLNRDLSMTAPYPFDYHENDAGNEVDPRPVIRRIAMDVAAGVPLAVISRRFHSSVVEMVVTRCKALRQTHGIEQVVLSGGVFLNEFLAVNCLVKLRDAAFAAYGHRLVPCNDGGISLGQVMVAAAQVRARTKIG